ncbi:hypothetical protein DFH27DRAFT_529631 [Peziza echinospora]|nr:hypothetical protein DFH27DRAFT_529631 [Peziza echinospora]
MDLISWDNHAGIQFGKKETIEFWTKFLQCLENIDISGKVIGWIQGNEEGYWLDCLRSEAMQLILGYLQAETFWSGGYRTKAMNINLTKIGSPHEAAPALHIGVILYDEMYLEGPYVQIPEPIVGNGEDKGKEKKWEGPVRPAQKSPVQRILSETDNRLEKGLHESEVSGKLDGILKNICTQSETSEQNMVSQFADAINERGIYPSGAIKRERLHTISESKYGETPDWYATQLSNEYASMNVWGQELLEAKLKENQAMIEEIKKKERMLQCVLEMEMEAEANLKASEKTLNSMREKESEGGIEPAPKLSYGVIGTGGKGVGESSASEILASMGKRILDA